MEFRMWRGLSRIEKAITSGLCPGPPDLAKPFDLYIFDRRESPLRYQLKNWDTLLAQKLGLVAYFSKQLDQTAKGWIKLLWAVAATTTLLKDAEKLIFGQPSTI